MQLDDRDLAIHAALLEATRQGHAELVELLFNA
jgi:hypothetical protein